MAEPSQENQGYLVCKTLPLTVSGEIMWVIPAYKSWVRSKEASDGKSSKVFCLRLEELERTYRFHLRLCTSKEHRHGEGKDVATVFLYSYRSDEQAKISCDFEVVSRKMQEKSDSLKSIVASSSESDDSPSVVPFLGYAGYSGHKNLVWDSNEPLLNGNLVIKGCITVRLCPTDRRLTSGQKLKLDMMALLREGKFSDFKIICGMDVYPVHKAILASKSKVFQAMFDCSESQECRVGCVIIKDCEPEDVWGMLEFIYSGSLNDDLGFCNEGVLKIADKYDIPDLVSKCTEAMTIGLNMENAITTLITADKFSMINFKALVAKHIHRNLAEVMLTKEWREMVKHYPRVMEDILRVKTTKE